MTRVAGLGIAPSLGDMHLLFTPEHFCFGAPIPWSVGLYLHPASSAGDRRIVSTGFRQLADLPSVLSIDYHWDFTDIADCIQKVTPLMAHI